MKEFTINRLKDEFYLYKATKTDTLVNPPKINIHIGADGITHEQFAATLNHQLSFIVKRVHQENYFYYPFREMIISKDPKIKSPSKAIALGKERILSIASIRDVLVQKVVYDYVYPVAEEKFKSLPSTVSFGYRKDMNASKAAQKIYKDINDGYVYALDADLEKFFDTIPQKLLASKVKELLGDSTTLYKLLYRFIHVDRVEWDSYKGRTEEFKRKKPVRSVRKEGIPQGGILSGLLANIYLHQFDEWVLNELAKEIPLRYTRYADDFIVMVKEEKYLNEIKQRCYEFLVDIGLRLHMGNEKTKMLDLSQKGKFVNFVGFSISKKHIQIQRRNIGKFKDRISEVLHDTQLENSFTLEILKLKLDYKFIGNEVKKRICKNCGMQENNRSWLAFFLTITDVQQLRSLDKWIKKEIYKKYYQDTNKRLSRKKFKGIGYLSLVETYFRYKEQGNNISFCRCSPLNAIFEETESPYNSLVSSDVYEELRNY